MRRDDVELRPAAALKTPTRRAYIGAAAEDAVADLLVARGFAILWRNLRLGRLELDIVARAGALVVVVEVRSRGATAFETGLSSVSPRKRALVLRATEVLWRTRLRAMRDVQRVRIDVAAVHFDEGSARIEYVEGAIVAG